MGYRAYGIDAYTSDNVDGGYIDHVSTGFDQGVRSLKENLEIAHKRLAGDKANPGDPGNPQVLADYQKAHAEYTLFRSAQAAAVKAAKEIAQNIISKWG